MFKRLFLSLLAFLSLGFEAQGSMLPDRVERRAKPVDHYYYSGDKDRTTPVSSLTSDQQKDLVILSWDQTRNKGLSAMPDNALKMDLRLRQKVDAELYKEDPFYRKQGLKTYPFLEMKTSYADLTAYDQEMEKAIETSRQIEKTYFELKQQHPSWSSDLLSVMVNVHFFRTGQKTLLTSEAERAWKQAGIHKEILLSQLKPQDDQAFKEKLQAQAHERNKAAGELFIQFKNLLREKAAAEKEAQGKAKREENEKKGSTKLDEQPLKGGTSSMGAPRSNLSQNKGQGSSSSRQSKHTISSEDDDEMPLENNSKAARKRREKETARTTTATTTTTTSTPSFKPRVLTEDQRLTLEQELEFLRSSLTDYEKEGMEIEAALAQENQVLEVEFQTLEKPLKDVEERLKKAQEQKIPSTNPMGYAGQQRYIKTLETQKAQLGKELESKRPAFEKKKQEILKKQQEVKKRLDGIKADMQVKKAELGEKESLFNQANAVDELQAQGFILNSDGSVVSQNDKLAQLLEEKENLETILLTNAKEDTLLEELKQQEISDEEWIKAYLQLHPHEGQALKTINQEIVRLTPSASKEKVGEDDDEDLKMAIAASLEENSSEESEEEQLERATKLSTGGAGISVKEEKVEVSEEANLQVGMALKVYFQSRQEESLEKTRKSLEDQRKNLEAALEMLDEQGETGDQNAKINTLSELVDITSQLELLNKTSSGVTVETARKDQIFIKKTVEETGLSEEIIIAALRAME